MCFCYCLMFGLMLLLLLFVFFALFFLSLFGFMEFGKLITSSDISRF